MSMPMKFFVGVALGKRYGVFAFAASQFEDDRAVVAEEVGVPPPLERMVVAEYGLELRLHEAGEGEIFSEAAQFVFSHDMYLFSAFYDVDSDRLDPFDPCGPGSG